MWISFLKQADESIETRWKDRRCVQQQSEISVFWTGKLCKKEILSFEAEHNNTICLLDKEEFGGVWTSPVCNLDKIDFAGAWTQALCEKQIVAFSGIWSQPVCNKNSIEYSGSWTSVICEKSISAYSAEFDSLLCSLDRHEFMGVWTTPICLKSEQNFSGSWTSPVCEKVAITPEPPVPTPGTARLLGGFLIQNDSSYEVMVNFPIQFTGLVFANNVTLSPGGSAIVNVNNGLAQIGQRWAIIPMNELVRFENMDNFSVSNASVSSLPTDTVIIEANTFNNTECWISGNLRITNAPMI